MKRDIKRDLQHIAGNVASLMIPESRPGNVKQPAILTRYELSRIYYSSHSISYRSRGKHVEICFST